MKPCVLFGHEATSAFQLEQMPRLLCPGYEIQAMKYRNACVMHVCRPVENTVVGCYTSSHVHAYAHTVHVTIL